jgi:hypothetical protein
LFYFQNGAKVKPICLHQSRGHSQGPIPSIIKLQLLRNFHFNVVPMTTYKHFILSTMSVSLMKSRWFFESIFLSKCIKCPLIYLMWSKLSTRSTIWSHWSNPKILPKIIPKLSPLYFNCKDLKGMIVCFVNLFIVKSKNYHQLLLTSFRVCHKAIENKINSWDVLIQWSSNE